MKSLVSACCEGEHEPDQAPQGEHEDQRDDQAHDDVLSWLAMNEIAFTIALALYAEAGGQNARKDLTQRGRVLMLFFWIHDGTAGFPWWPVGAKTSVRSIIRSG